MVLVAGEWGVAHPVLRPMGGRVLEELRGGAKALCHLDW